MSKKIKTITVIGKRWFDKTYGNTYCSARVYFDNVEVCKVPWTYGYGNFYEQAASERVEKLGLLKDHRITDLNNRESLYAYAARNNIEYMSHHSDGLKRDMVSWGGDK